MLRKFAMSLGLGVSSGLVAAGVKWAGAFAVPTAFLYAFYDQVPLFEQVHGESEHAVAQMAILLLTSAAVAWAIASIPVTARRVVIVLGAVLISFFLSPVLAMFGWKLEPFSWLLGLLVAALSTIAVFPGRAASVAADTIMPQPRRHVDEPEATPAGDDPASARSAERSSALRTPESALAAAALAAATREQQQQQQRTDETPSATIAARNKNEATLLLCSVFSSAKDVKGYAGTVRAFLERADAFLRSAGASDTETGADFVRATFVAIDGDDVHAHARSACDAALLLGNHLETFLDASDSEATDCLRFGVGVESAVWSVETLEVPGECREFAGQLSLFNQRLGCTVIVGARAHRLAGTAIEVRPLELTEDPVTGAPVEVYELLGAAGTLNDEALARRDAFWEGIVCLRSGLATEDALERFERARVEGVDDPVLDYFEAVARGGRPCEEEDTMPAPVAQGGDDNDEEDDACDDELLHAIFLRESDGVDVMEAIAVVESDDADAAEFVAASLDDADVIEAVADSDDIDTIPLPKKQ